MQSLKAYLVNAFTREKSGTNPTGVVLNATGFSEKQMQFTADKISVSHTAFEVKVKKVNDHLETVIGGTAAIETEMVIALNYPRSEYRRLNQC